MKGGVEMSGKTLNDGFLHLEPSPFGRKDYRPGDVDREKIFKAWEQKFDKAGRKIPTDFEALAALSNGYIDRSFQAKLNNDMAGFFGYAYFAKLLMLRAAILTDMAEAEKELRYRMRELEMLYPEQKFLPKP
jgi:hypothetical protein